MLGTLVLTLDNNPAGNMDDADCGIGFVDVLTTGATGTKGINAQVALLISIVGQLIGRRQDRNRTG